MKERIEIPVCGNLVMKLGDVIEFNGEEGTGKSEILMHAAAHCILPQSLSGCERDVIFISIDHNFDITRFAVLVEHKLQTNTHTTENAILNRTMFESTLERFHLLNSFSTNDCCMALMCTSYRYRNIGLVIIDNIGILRGESEDQKVEDLVDILKNLITEYKPLVIISQLSPVMSTGYKPICKSWQKLVDYRFQVSKFTTNLGTNILIQQRYPNSAKLYKFIIH